MIHKSNSIIIGKGSGLSKLISQDLGIPNLPSNQLSNLNLSSFQNIIYTSCDPSNNLIKKDIKTYLEKNILNIYRIVKSGFRGKFTYISSIDTGHFEITRNDLPCQSEKMFTPYSLSKYFAESLILSENKFHKCNILRLGLIFPTKSNNNFYRALNSKPESLNINLNSSFYITPYSLVSKFLNSNKAKQEKLNYGYLSSSNKVHLSDIFKLRNIKYKSLNNNLYTYRSKDKEKNIDDLVENINYNWQEEQDYNSLIGKCLNLNRRESILPY